jgi:hypothetical protein
MTLTPAATRARAAITRSDRLYFDTRTLRYSAGIAHEEELEPAAVKELLDADELRVIYADASGVITMNLTPESFRLGLAGRSRAKAPQKIVWAHYASISASGMRVTDNVLASGQLEAFVAIPFNGSLLSKLLHATSDAIDSFGRDPRQTGATLRFPGHILPGKAVTVRDNPLDLLPFFEAVDLRVLINAANGQYAFATRARGIWLVSDSEPISGLLAMTAPHLGDRVSRNVIKLAERLERHALVDERVSHADEESPAVMAAIKDAADAVKHGEAA